MIARGDSPFKANTWPTEAILWTSIRRIQIGMEIHFFV